MARLSKSYQILVYTAVAAADLPRYSANELEKQFREAQARTTETVGGKRESKRVAKRLLAAEDKGARAEVFAGEGLLNLYAQFEVAERARTGALYVKELEV